ncbi:aspartate dehydrogenase [Oceanobacillus luteolus]|uniref:L-aspartate dehydrogenase n=1 Tax=Oceanobacillus luteolus TaxID=1274358 RepID=A0ABW4HWE1_9BACI|nr:aspartate dehydrogenase [Oceanobacillus luteolus]MCM3741338.1 aspartate dehydrogenase [Oceanobacillus luteolus]
MNVGLIGAGAIANFLLKEINLSQKDTISVKSVYVRNKEKYEALESEFGVKLYTDLHAFLDSEIDIVVEAANVEAVKTLIPECIKKKDVVLISVGALVDNALLLEVEQLAEKHNHFIHLPSGAIGGLDLLQNAHALGTVTSVSITTRKPAHSLIDEPLTEEKIIFEGKAADAIIQFPKNINVSIVLSLASLGIHHTTVRMIADPHIEKNIHQVEMKGEFGDATFTIKNNPLPSNPKTSYLAAMSILGTLKRLESKIKIG